MSRCTYEIRPSHTHHKKFCVIKIKGRLNLGYVATAMSRQDAVAFKRLKEIQSQAASIRNRRVNRKQRIAAPTVASFMAHGVATLADGSTIG